MRKPELNSITPIFSVFLCFLCLVIGSVLPLAAQASSPGNEGWRLLEKARLDFEAGSYGTALHFCELAREQHLRDTEYKLTVLTRSLAPAEVRRAGDNIDEVYAVLQKRNDSAALAILDTILMVKPREFFEKSIQRILSWLEKRKAYPEAEILTGMIYEAEGEYGQAMHYYELARNNSEMLDIPNEKYTLLYRMADLAALGTNPFDAEAFLLMVLTDDALFGSTDQIGPVLASMVSALEKDQDIERFFMLYRHDNFLGLKAFRDLSVFYRNSGRPEKAMPVASLAAVIIITRLSEAVKAADLEYGYSNLSDLFRRCGNSRDIMKWAGDNKVWDSLLLFARTLESRGGRKGAYALRSALAENCPDSYYAAVARHELAASSTGN